MFCSYKYWMTGRPIARCVGACMRLVTGNLGLGAYPWYTSSSTSVRVSTDVPWSITATACPKVALCVEAGS